MSDFDLFACTRLFPCYSQFISLRSIWSFLVCTRI